MITKYDIVVIGSGVGGSSVASRAAELGLQVLILDNGGDLQPNLLGETEIVFNLGSNVKQMKIPTIKGAGGNSLIYGGHLTRYPERYWKESSDSHIPIDYKKISVYYDEIIKKFNISPKKFNLSELKVKEAFKTTGFGSEEIIWAISNHPDCNGCGGYLCPRNCKKDFFSMLCTPLINQGRLIHWTNSTISDVSVAKDDLSIIKIKRLEKDIFVTTNFIVFSCGTFGSPAEIVRLFGDKLDRKALDQIGRRVMFHISDFFIIIPKFLIFNKLRTKLLCSSENIIMCNKKKVFFSIQSVGAELSGATIYRYIYRRNNRLFNKYEILKKILWIFSHILALPLKCSHIIASVVEDPSLLNNNQSIGLHPINVNYRIDQNFINSIKEINKIIKKNLKSKFFIFKFSGDFNINFGHAMGGMTMGVASHSVIDANCKLNGLDNIYVCDASVLPYSAATNPSLTIAAIGYHVANCLFKLTRNNIQKNDLGT